MLPISFLVYGCITQLINGLSDGYILFHSVGVVSLQQVLFRVMSGSNYGYAQKLNII